MAKNFKELRAKMSPEARARSEAKTAQMIKDMAIDELRAARDLTQKNLSQVLGITQEAVSQLENRTDMYVSTLGRFIQAMGGRLEIHAVFPEGDVKITQFEKLVSGAVNNIVAEAKETRRRRPIRKYA